MIIRGHKDKVELCKTQLLEDTKEWDSQKEDRALRSYSLNLTVDHRHHRKIIGGKGVVINAIKVSPCLRTAVQPRLQYSRISTPS